MSEEELNQGYNDLAFYTLPHSDPKFIHQHIVDAFAAQTATKDFKPIKLAFALMGLYLYLEKRFTGKQVQQAHMQLAKRQKTWPKFELPDNRGAITVKDVLEVSPGEERDKMIRKWCESAWLIYKPVHEQVGELVEAVLWQDY